MESTNTRPSNIMIFAPFNLPEKETNEAYERAVAHLKEDMEFTDEEMDALNVAEVYHEIYDAVKERIIDNDPEANVFIEVAVIGTLLTMMSGADIVYFTKGATDDPDLAMLRDFAIRHKIEVGEERPEPTSGHYPWDDDSDDKIYTGSGETKTVRYGVYRNYYWKILSIRGSHPCCYIHIPEGHSFYKMGYDDVESFCYAAGVDLNAHGGLTYAGDLDDDGNYWIGWDYARAYDYLRIKDSLPFNPAYEHMWTVDELTDDIHGVIDVIADEIDTLKE